ncbi:hypothetical protein H1R20_g8544, partial [Candolleomyces eurysporus]
MPRFQFEIAITLAASVVASILAFYWAKQKREGKIQLPTHNDEELDGDHYSKHDPLEVTTPEDVIDGYPLEEEAFWRRMQWRKTYIAVLLALVVSLNIVVLGCAFANNETEELIIASLQLSFSFYLLVLAGDSAFQNNVNAHSTAILHLTTLTTVASLLLGSAAILPEGPPPVAKDRSSPSFLSVLLGTSDNVLLNALWITIVVLYTLTTTLAFTTPLGPPLHYPPEYIYSEKTVKAITNGDPENVSGLIHASLWDLLTFSYTTKVVWLGNIAESLEIGDLPIVPANMRATLNYSRMRQAMRTIKFCIFNWTLKAGPGWGLMYRLFRLNWFMFFVEFLLSGVLAGLLYAPAFFLRQFIAYLEIDSEREQTRWGWVYVLGIFMSYAILSLITGQWWFLSTTTMQVRLKVQLNTVLFSKTLVRKNVVSSSSKPKDQNAARAAGGDAAKLTAGGDDEDEFSSKAQIMTLITTDVDRVSDVAWHLFFLIDPPIEIVIGTVFLYSLLGVSCFFGLAVILVFLPLNHFAGTIFVGAQENLMKARDERVALMNEILGSIRMLKFMAWERSFEKRVLAIRQRELRFQKLHYTIETLWYTIWDISPILVTLVAFWHYTVYRGQPLTPSIAFTSIIVFKQMKFALNALPRTFISLLQTFVSLRRIENYLDGAEVNPVAPLQKQSKTIALQSCTITWSQDPMGSNTSSLAPSASSTPRHKFLLMDLSLNFPQGDLSLICGKLGSGKTLLLLALLGEADILTGQLMCPRSPPDSLASYAKVAPGDEWIVDGMCAYVPQACALISDLEILEDGDESEIGERGVNLSGGQKARVSLARAVYSRASVLFLDDVLSAVDAHTAHHLYHQGLKGDLMKGRTVILVSHHVQLCAGGASYIVALDNGRVLFQGGRDAFQSSGIIRKLGQTSSETGDDCGEKGKMIEIEPEVLEDRGGQSGTRSTTAAASSGIIKEKKTVRKLVEEEKRAVGRVKRDIWMTFIWACGHYWYWTLFGATFIITSITPVLENTWLRLWSALSLSGEGSESSFYILIYTAITGAGLVFATIRKFVLYHGSIHASTILYERLLETVLFADIRFHETVSRGRLLNRYGKDFEGVDSSLANNFESTIISTLSALTTIITVSFVGGIPFVIVIMVLGVLYYNAAKIYGQTSRDMRRLVNRWLSIRFELLAAAVVGAASAVCLMTPTISASLAGFTLAFASTITYDLLFMVYRFVGLEQSMVALERIKEYSDLKREPPEIVEPRPDASWPSQGDIKCEDLVVRYAPDLPDVLHHLNFEIRPGEKVGILGRTGSGKSTLALSLFRFVEPTQGRIVVDGVDISKIGLADLRGKLTIIPQDPSILSGTLRSTLDLFDEYEDAEIYEALRRVHLIPSDSESTPEGNSETVNANVFRDLDFSENFSTGEKQLLCMARAILKRSKVLVMDEATASVDYATDELISKTIRQEFAESTILTIAHRLRTVIDYDRVMLLDEGRIIEFDKPSALLSDSSSQFYALCKATGKEEFANLQTMAGVSM